MFRQLITIVAAASVLWHTVAGCCAHQSHAATVGIAWRASIGVHQSETNAIDCSVHQHECAPHSSSSLDERPPHDSDHKCPGPPRSKCGHDSCVFASPSSPISVQALHADIVGWVYSVNLSDRDCDVELHRSRPFYRSALFPAGKVRAHLAIGVILA